MGCVQSYFKRAHTAGLSPSSTQDSNSKTAAVEEEVKPIIAEEKSLTEEPESNDTSYGVEATAVRTLAASTGTVAILGTTAKTNGKNDDEEEDKQVETIPEENENQDENKTVSIEKVEIHKPSETEKNNVNIENSKSDILENSKIKDERVEENNIPLTTQLPSSGNIPNNENQPLNDKVSVKVENEVLNELSNENSRENSVLSRASDSSQNISSLSKTETVGESPITVVEVKEKVIEGSSVANGTNQEPNKDVEEDNSKSISSERLKTNSISDTTLSESYNAELENNSVKQSPSVEKVLESFDSSSTVEFVDVGNREATRSKRSIDEDLIDGSVSSTSLRSTSVDIINQNKENLLTPTEFPSVATEILSPTHENSISMLSSIPDHTSPVKEELSTPTTGEASENNKSEETTPIQTENQLKETLNINSIQEDTVVPSVDSPFEEPKPVSAVVVSPIKPVQIEDNVNIESSVQNGVVEVEKSCAEEISPSVPKEVNQLEKDVSESNTNSFDLDEKLVSAATTIQASFRGYQTRQNLKTEEPETDSVIKELSSNSEEVSDQLNSAATTIQASFRGYQERRNIKNEEIDKDIQSNEEFENVTKITKNQEGESNKDSTATDQSLEAEKSEKVSDDIKSQINLEEVIDELNAAATTIQSNFRGFQARQNLKSNDVEQDTTEVKDNNTELSLDTEVKDDLNNAATTIQATFRGFKARQNLKNEEPEKDIETEESVQLENENLDKLNSAATTIQSTFRGFQARQNVQQNDNIEASENEKKLFKNDVNTQEVLNSDTSVNLEENENNEQLASAATTIQATFRGFQTRQNLKNPQTENNEIVENSKSSNELNSAATTIQANFRGFQTRKNIQNGNVDTKTEVEEPKTEVEEEPKTENDNQLGSAATTIQAAFRGFQTRQDLKKDQIVGDLEIEESLATLDEVIKAESANYNNSEDQEKPEENLEKKDDEFSDKLNNAASTIQATFREFQTRQNLKNFNSNQNEENFNNNKESFDKKTPLSLTPEILDSVKEEVNDICKQAIATTESILAGKKDVEKLIINQENEALVTESINHKEETKGTLDIPSDKMEVLTEENKDYLLDESDDKLASAATTIQASFRGFQARQNLQKMVDTEEQPDVSNLLSSTGLFKH